MRELCPMFYPHPRLRRALSRAALAAVVIATATLPTPGAADEPVTGALQRGGWSHVVPLDLPPAPAGLVPDLALGFDFRSPDGLVGPGWNVAGLSRIDRHGDMGQGVPGWSTGDRFVLDGQLLWEEGAYFHTEIDDERYVEPDPTTNTWVARREGRAQRGTRRWVVLSRTSPTIPSTFAARYPASSGGDVDYWALEPRHFEGPGFVPTLVRSADKDLLRRIGRDTDLARDWPADAVVRPRDLDADGPFRDVAPSSAACPLVSARVRRVWDSGDLTGAIWLPVAVSALGGNALGSGFLMLAVAKPAYALDEMQVEYYPEDYVIPQLRGRPWKFLSPRVLDGLAVAGLDAVTSTEDSTRLYVSDRAKRILEDAGIEGFVYRPARVRPPLVQ